MNMIKKFIALNLIWVSSLAMVPQAFAKDLPVDENFCVEHPDPNCIPFSEMKAHKAASQAFVSTEQTRRLPQEQQNEECLTCGTKNRSAAAMTETTTGSTTGSAAPASPRGMDNGEGP